MSYCASSCICSDLNTRYPFMNTINFMIIKETLGALAGTFSGIMFIPYVISTCKSRGKESISLNFIVLTYTATFFWLLYGITIFSISTIILEVFVSLNLTIISIMKFIAFYKKRKETTRDVIENQSN